jgi:peptidoglycan hydrolase-like protein with peptidoglycan-binding domain
MPAHVLPTLSLGSQGRAVQYLQRYLNLLGADLSEDGVFGPSTRQAVITFQAQAGVRQDGIVGPVTWTAIESNLGISVDVDGSPEGGGYPNPEQLPDADTPASWFTPTKLAIGGLLLIGVGTLAGGERRKK